MLLGRRMRKRLLVLGGSFLALFGATEVGLRVAGFDPLGEYLDGREVAIRPSDRPGLIYELTPGVEARVWDSDVSINRRGFRDRDYPTAKEPGVLRVVALGDSITFGNRLAVEEVWPKRLEALLASRGIPAEILNLGVGGYDTRQEVAFLEHVGLAFSPDVVLVAYCINDVATASVNLDTIERLGRYRGPLFRYSRLAQWLGLRFDDQNLRDAMRAMRREEEEELDTTPDTDPTVVELQRRLAEALPWIEAASSSPDDEETHERLSWYAHPGRLRRLRSAFARLAELSAERGFRLALFVVPYLDEGPRRALAPTWTTVYELVEHEARRAGFELVDVRGPLRRAGLEKLLMKGRDRVHPNARGHCVIAQVLADFLDRSSAEESER